MQDFADEGNPCGSKQTEDQSYNAGLDASSAASADKSSFLALWNPIAPRYGEPTYSEDQL
jgi:hypothetical protein